MIYNVFGKRIDSEAGGSINAQFVIGNGLRPSSVRMNRVRKTSDDHVISAYVKAVTVFEQPADATLSSRRPQRTLESPFILKKNESRSYQDRIYVCEWKIWKIWVKPKRKKLMADFSLVIPLLCPVIHQTVRLAVLDSF